MRADVSVLPVADLHAGGAGLGLQVAAACPRGMRGLVDLQVGQHGNLSFTMSTAFTCKGGAVAVPVGIGSSGLRFTAGGAFVRANLIACSLDGCVRADPGARSVTISRGPLIVQRDRDHGYVLAEHVRDECDDDEGGDAGGRRPDCHCAGDLPLHQLGQRHRGRAVADGCLRADCFER